MYIFDRLYGKLGIETVDRLLDLRRSHFIGTCIPAISSYIGHSMYTFRNKKINYTRTVPRSEGYPTGARWPIDGIDSITVDLTDRDAVIGVQKRRRVEALNSNILGRFRM
jgi:hypothetical protein